MSAQQFMEVLFGRLPEFFKDEAELRTIWSGRTRAGSSWKGSARKGFRRDQLIEMQKVIDAEKKPSL